MRRLMVGSAAVVSVLLISGCSNLPFGGGSSDSSDRMERRTKGGGGTSPGTSGIPGSGPMGTTPGSRTY